MKAKKLTFYATALMSHLFSDEEMRQGSVEPKETSKGKKALDQTKVNALSLAMLLFIKVSMVCSSRLVIFYFTEKFFVSHAD